MARIGFGYDVHRLVPGRELVLGGVHIPYKLGLLGHSDADAAVHALMDAILGAMGMGDIGTHFPDSDPQYKNADSLDLLSKVRTLMEKAGYFLGNADLTIAAQEPKLAPYIPQMRRRIANIFGCGENKISVKATTEEGLGFTGEKLGIKCYAVCLLEERCRSGETID